MSLPKLNQNINFKVKIPSFNKEYTSRPYLAKEEKILLFAFETKNNQTILSAILQVLDNCIDLEDRNVKELTMVDIEYAFIQIRSLSVSEISEIIHNCEECKAENNLSVDLRDIEIKGSKEYSSIIDLDKQNNISIRVKYPCIGDMLKLDNSIFESDAETSVNVNELFKIFELTIDKVIVGDEQTEFKEQSKEEKENFVNSFNSKQLESVMNFFYDMPQCYLKHEYECSNEECKHKNVLELSGIQNFF